MTRKSVPDAAASKPSARATSGARASAGAASKPAPKTTRALKATAADVAVAKANTKKTRGTAKAEPAKRSVKAAPKAADKAQPKAAKPAARVAVKPAKPAKSEAKAGAKPAARSAAPKGPALAAKTAAKALVKASGKPAAGGARGRSAVPAPAASESARPALVRDSFTMPEQEYVVLADVKQACLKAGFEVKKSELLRIGVALVGRLDMATLRQVLDGLPQLKTGRPPSQ